MGAALRPYAYDPDRRIIRIPLLRRLYKDRITTYRYFQKHNYGHATAKELKAALPAKVFDNFYKFTFVRNPWDWQVSIYHFVIQNELHPQREFFKTFGSFENYLDWYINKGVQLQKDFALDDAGNLIVDFIGHYETIQDDFEAVCKQINIQPALPHKNRSEHKNFREHYTAQTRAMVAEAFREDIEFFGYQFEEQEPLPPIVALPVPKPGNRGLGVAQSA
jgi:hypothetical protein